MYKVEGATEVPCPGGDRFRETLANTLVFKRLSACGESGYATFTYLSPRHLPQSGNLLSLEMRRGEELSPSHNLLVLNKLYN